MRERTALMQIGMRAAYSFTETQAAIFPARMLMILRRLEEASQFHSRLADLIVRLVGGNDRQEIYWARGLLP
jgi:hypothetical protein